MKFLLRALVDHTIVLSAKQVKYNFEAEDEIESDGEGSVVDNLAVVEDQPAVVSDVSDGDSDFEAPVEKSKPANQ
jgi:hypothetical protein